MEFTPRPFEADEPDKAGEAKTSRKRKKKATRVPLTAAIEKDKGQKTKAEKAEAKRAEKKSREAATEPAPEEPETKDETKDASVEFTDTAESEPEPEPKPEPETEQIAEDEEELVLPEVEATPEGTDYQGELVIDHSEEPPRVAPPLPFVMNAPPFARAEAAPDTADETFGYEPYVVLPPAPEELAAASTPQPEAPNVTVTVPTPERIKPIPVVPEEEANERTYRAEKRGLSRGVVSGGLVGWWLGRRGKRAVEREAHAAIENHGKIIDRLTRERDTEREERARQRTVLRQTQGELRDLKRNTEERTAEAPTRPEISPVPPVIRAVERVLHFEVPHRTPRTAETIAEAPRQPAVRSEADREKIISREPSPEDQPITEEMYEVPEGRRVEQSAWHRIEIDEKTGKTVEKPSVAYGEAFARERRQEKLARDAAQATAAAQVGMTAVMSGSNEAVQPLASASTGRTASFGMTVKRVSHGTAAAARQVARNTTEPLTWLAALLVVVLLFATGIIN